MMAIKISPTFGEFDPKNQPKPKKDFLKISEWQKAHTVVKNIRLNKEYDKDILDKLASQENVQGYVKSLIRADIAKSNP